MTNVTLMVSEFQDHAGEALDRSLSQPVVITKHGRPRNVVLSCGEYERLSARDRLADHFRFAWSGAGRNDRESPDAHP